MYVAWGSMLCGLGSSHTRGHVGGGSCLTGPTGGHWQPLTGHLQQLHYNQGQCSHCAAQVLYTEAEKCKLQLPSTRYYSGEDQDRLLLIRNCEAGKEVLVLKIADVSTGGGPRQQGMLFLAVRN